MSGALLYSAQLVTAATIASYGLANDRVASTLVAALLSPIGGPISSVASSTASLWRGTGGRSYIASSSLALAVSAAGIMAVGAVVHFINTAKSDSLEEDRAKSEAGLTLSASVRRVSQKFHVMYAFAIAFVVGIMGRAIRPMPAPLAAGLATATAVTAPLANAGILLGACMRSRASAETADPASKKERRMRIMTALALAGVNVAGIITGEVIGSLFL